MTSTSGRARALGPRSARLSALLTALALAAGLLGASAPLVGATNVQAAITIGANSCIGTDACTDAVGPIGDNSCNGDLACAETLGSVGDNSCDSHYACESAAGSIGDNSCNGESGCFEGDTVGDNSCHEDYACYGATASIGDSSCQASNACYETSGSVGTGACVGYSACNNAAGPIGANSCNGAYACAGSNDSVGDNSCNGYKACYEALTAVSDCADNLPGYIPAVCVQPDGQVKRPGGRLNGKGVYNDDGAGQMIYGGHHGYPVGTRRTVYLYVRNDGSIPAAYTYTASGDDVAGFVITYHRRSGRDLTDQVNAGTFTTPTLDPGARYAILATITITPDAAPQSSVSRLITIAAVDGEASAIDAIGFGLNSQ